MYGFLIFSLPFSLFSSLSSFPIMSSPQCDSCNLPIEGIPLECDGICFRKFHPDCSPTSKRILRSNTSSSFTCSVCVDIKPCHALRACHTISSDLNILSDKLSSILQKFSTFENTVEFLTSDYCNLSTKLDSLNFGLRTLSSTSDKLSDITHRNLNLTKNLVDTISDINLSPDLHPIRDELATLHKSCKRICDALHDSLPQSPGSFPASAHATDSMAYISSVSSPTVSKHLPLPKPSSVPSPNNIPTPHSPVSPMTLSPTLVPSLNLIPSFPPVNNDPLPPPKTPNNSHSQSVPIVPSSTNTPSTTVPPITSPHAPVEWVPLDVPAWSALYVGRCKTSTTDDDIIHFISSSLNIRPSLIRCRRLVNPSRPLIELSFISFKISIPSQFLAPALNYSWPLGAVVTQFKPKINPLASSIPKNPQISLNPPFVT